jgi:hypothetical protein
MTSESVVLCFQLLLDYFFFKILNVFPSLSTSLHVVNLTQMEILSFIFNDVYYIASNNLMAINNELERISKEFVV